MPFGWLLKLFLCALVGYVYMYLNQITLQYVYSIALELRFVDLLASPHMHLHVLLISSIQSLFHPFKLATRYPYMHNYLFLHVLFTYFQ